MEDTNVKKFISLGLLVMLVVSAFALVFTPFATVEAQGNARLRVAHLSPDAPSVDVYANDNKVLSNVPFKAVSDYLTVPAAKYTLKVFAAGADAKTATPVINADATVEAGKDYTVAATGKLAAIKPTILVDDNSAPAAGKARIRVFHASPDAPAVDIAVKGGAVVVPNLAFPSASGYLSLDAGTYDLEVRAAGTTTVAFPINGLKLEAGKTYTAIAAGLLTASPVSFTVLPTVDATAAPAATSPALPSTGLGGAAQEGLNLTWLALALVVVAGGSAIALRRVRR